LPYLANVAVNVPLQQLFTYRVADTQIDNIEIGSRVLIPFGRRVAVGFVVSLGEGQAENLKDIKEVLDKEPLLTEGLIKLLSWAAEYYCHPIGQVFCSALPAGLGREKSQNKIITEPWYCAVDTQQNLRGKKQKELYSFIAKYEYVALSEIRQHIAAPHAALKRLVDVGALCIEQREVIRDPFLNVHVDADKCLILNDAQKSAVDAIADSLSENNFRGFLLHGVTGSGKTEVYLRAVERCLDLGRQALILVPEISLTPQLVARFRARFESNGIKISVLHSGLSAGERYDAWREIIKQQIDVVIGARSAIFAPLNSLGLIVVDEEHESSYKQGEGFRYSGRDLALVRAQQQNCPIVLGSATPSLASFYRSEQGALMRLSLEQRVHAGDLPAVEIVDLKGHTSEGELSNPLIEAIQKSLEEREQILLLLNRRGFAPFLLCSDCGESFYCPNCEITLTYHQTANHLKCHYCDYSEPVPESCHKCQGLNIITNGAGTERLEQELKELFPGARVARMDRDTTSHKGAHQKIVDAMLAREIDILVGTQMVAKGHDFPGVALVGVLSADSLLNFPDFRSAERCFSLLTQVAGRAGREGGGRVYIQTYNADHYALSCAAQHAYADFYRQELPFRQELEYPPCGHLVNLVFASNDHDLVQRSAQKFGLDLQRLATDIEILGPSPCPLSRLRGKSRYQILLKSTDRRALRRCLDRMSDVTAKIPRCVQLHIDVDPLDML